MIRIFQDHICRIEHYFAVGGIVMLPLMIISVLMWTLIINRSFFFRRLYRKNMSRERAAEYVMAGVFSDSKRYRGATSLLVTDFLNRKSGSPALDRFILDETVLALVSSLDRHLALIGVLASLAPLLGLLGTVTGMIATFDIISIFGTGNAKAMSGGISEALVTTQTGLIVAIPGLYMSNFLNRRAENLKQQISAVGIYLSRYV